MPGVLSKGQWELQGETPQPLGECGRLRRGRHWRFIPRTEHQVTKAFVWKKDPVRKWWFFCKWSFFAFLSLSTNFQIASTSFNSSPVCFHPGKWASLFSLPCKICDISIMLACCFLIFLLKAHIPYSIKCISSKSQLCLFNHVCLIELVWTGSFYICLWYKFFWLYISWIR